MNVRTYVELQRFYAEQLVAIRRQLDIAEGRITPTIDLRIVYPACVL